MVKGLDNNQEDEASQSKLKLELVSLQSGTIKDFFLLFHMSLEAINNNLNDWKQLSSII